MTTANRRKTTLEAVRKDQVVGGLRSVQDLEEKARSLLKDIDGLPDKMAGWVREACAALGVPLGFPEAEAFRLLKLRAWPLRIEDGEDPHTGEVIVRSPRHLTLERLAALTGIDLTWPDRRAGFYLTHEVLQRARTVTFDRLNELALEILQEAWLWPLLYERSEAGAQLRLELARDILNAYGSAVSHLSMRGAEVAPDVSYRQAPSLGGVPNLPPMASPPTLPSAPPPISPATARALPGIAKAVEAMP